MSEMLLTEVRQKFASARELCPGMSEEIYALTDYMSTVANDQLAPKGILTTLIYMMDDLEKKRCGFFAHEIEFPEYLATHNLQARAQLPYILQVVDAIAEPDFADEVRAECKEVLHWNIPKHVNISNEVSPQENINAAVNWWAEAIQHPKMDNGDDILTTFLIRVGGHIGYHQLTEPELQTFREKLAGDIAYEMTRRQNPNLTLNVNYGPDHILSEAGAAIGLEQFDFPCKTTMWITETEVSVSTGYGAPKQVVWRSTNA